MLVVQLLGETIGFDCDDPALRALLCANYPGPAGDHSGPCAIRYAVTTGDAPSFVLAREGRPPLVGDGADEFVFIIEKDLTVELQRRRPDLLFLHSAALERRGGAYLFAGASGVGKSTTAWALLHHGFGYLSDELAPIDLAAMRVEPYPHALCLKRVPAHYPLPRDALDLGTAIYIPPRSLPGGAIHEPAPLAAVFVLSDRHDAATPPLRELGRAEAIARLYPHALNALAHDNLGFDAIGRLVESVPCFLLRSGDVRATCALIVASIEGANASHFPADSLPSPHFASSLARA